MKAATIIITVMLTFIIIIITTAVRMHHSSIRIGVLLILIHDPEATGSGREPCRAGFEGGRAGSEVKELYLRFQGRIRRDRGLPLRVDKVSTRV